MIVGYVFLETSDLTIFIIGNESFLYQTETERTLSRIYVVASACIVFLFRILYLNLLNLKTTAKGELLQRGKEYVRVDLLQIHTRERKIWILKRERFYFLK